RNTYRRIAVLLQNGGAFVSAIYITDANTPRNLDHQPIFLSRHFSLRVNEQVGIEEFRSIFLVQNQRLANQGIELLGVVNAQNLEVSP
ncbi:hypothetical protein ABTD20_18970, partial [Acinetobacter baumannii]